MQKVDFTDFRKNCKQYEKELHKQSEQILRKCAVSFAKKASVYCPPPKTLGQSKIEKRFYTRPIKYVPDEVRKYKKEQDIEALRKGKLFKVTIEKNGKFDKNIYKKSLRMIKKYARIRNRGLFKVMFGANLQSIKESIPASIRSLMSKSKNLFNLKNLNRITEESELNRYSKIKIDNNAYNNESFAEIAVRHGDESAMKTLKKLLKQKAKEKIKL